MIFISYRKEDSNDLPLSLASALGARFGQENVFVDRANIIAGQNWRQRIEQELDKSNVVIAVIGTKWLLAADEYGRRRIDLEDDVLAYELETALRRSTPLIQLFVGGMSPLVAKALPDRLKPLAEKQGMPFEMARDFDNLLKVLPSGGSGSINLAQWSPKPPYKEMLKPLSFEAEKNRHLPGFTGRSWVEERLENWIQRRRSSRVFCLLGGPGIGKSALACHWCHTRPDVIAFHHCVHGYAEKTDPRRIFFSLAAQIAERIPAYEQRLAAVGAKEMQDIMKGDDRAVFENLLLKPLSGSFPAYERDCLIIIDGLDEATKGDENEMAKVIGEAWVGLPEWLRLVVTAREEFDVSAYLSSLHPFVLNASSPENMADIRAFLRREMPPEQASDAMINEIVAKSEGMFLYAHLVLDEIRAERLSLDRITDFPQGLTGYYINWFSRKFPDVGQYHEEFHELVSVVVAQKSPLPLDVLGRAVGLKTHPLQMRLRRLGVLFPLREEKLGNRSTTYVTLMHKSLHDWLTGLNPATQRYWAGNFSSDIELGNRLLAEEGWRTYEAGTLGTDAHFRETLLAYLADDGQSDRLVKVLFDACLVESLWFITNRTEWQRHISRLRHTVSLSKLVKNWIATQSLAGTHTSAAAVVAGKLCELFKEIGAFDEAMALGEEALRIWRENHVEGSAEMVGTYLALGDIQMRRDEFDMATFSHERAIEIAERAYAEDSPEMADVMYAMCVFYSTATRDYKKAMRCLERCYDICKGCNPPNLVGMANCVNDRAIIYSREGRNVDNLALYREALSHFEKATPRGHPEMVATLGNVADALLARHEPNEALPVLLRAAEMSESVLLPQHHYTQSTRLQLFSVLRTLGRDKDALEVMHHHVSEHERYPGAEHVDTAEARLAMCAALWSMVLSADASVSGAYRDEIRRQCQLIRRARPKTVVGLLSLSEVAHRASETGLHGYMLKAARRACSGGADADKTDDSCAVLPGCYGQIVDLVLSDQPVQVIGPTILEIWRRAAPTLEQKANLLSETRKGITSLITWYGQVRLDRSEDTAGVYEAYKLITQIGADTPETLDQLASLTVKLHHRHLDDISEELCQDLLDRADRILGSEHVQTRLYIDNLAFFKMFRNKFDEARSLFDRSLQVHLKECGPDSFGVISATVHMAECLLLQGRVDEAQQGVREYATRFPAVEETALARKTLARVLNQAALRQKNEFGCYNGARTCYELAIEFDPDAADVHSNFAMLLWGCLDAYDDADSHFQTSLQLNDGDFNTHSVYGLFLGQTREDHSGSVEHFERAAELEPHQAATHANHASVLLICGATHAAWPLATRAMRLCQPHPDRTMCRPLFVGAAALVLLGKDASVPLGQLKTLFTRRINHVPWVITALLKKLERDLPPGTYTLLKAVSAAIDDKGKLPQLENDPVWREIDAVPLETCWPEL